jgi:CDP-diacylglycerol--glycerol-3-phosphate 3-phosphatidyltransferase
MNPRIRSFLRALPNALSLLRLGLVPALVALAWAGAEGPFLVCLVAGFASDVADGFLARRTGSASELGARLDSWGDLALFGSLPLCAWLLWPEVMTAEARFLVVAVTAFVAPMLLGFARFGRLTSYHTWGAKLTSWLMGAGALVLFSGGPAWPFHVATVVLVAEALEEMAITVVLPRWRADVPTLWHALAEAR